MLSVRKHFFAHINRAPKISIAHCATPGHVCSTLYSNMYVLALEVSVMQTTCAAHGRVCSTAAYTGRRRVCYTAILCCPWKCLLYSKLIYSTPDCVATGRVCSTAAYMSYNFRTLSMRFKLFFGS
jgi:hypothetical protein